MYPPRLIRPLRPLFQGRLLLALRRPVQVGIPRASIQLRTNSTKTPEPPAQPAATTSKPPAPTTAAPTPAASSPAPETPAAKGAPEPTIFAPADIPVTKTAEVPPVTEAPVAEIETAAVPETPVVAPVDISVAKDAETETPVEVKTEEVAAPKVEEAPVVKEETPKIEVKETGVPKAEEAVAPKAEEVVAPKAVEPETPAVAKEETLVAAAEPEVAETPAEPEAEAVAAAPKSEAVPAAKVEGPVAVKEEVPVAAKEEAPVVEEALAAAKEEAPVVAKEEVPVAEEVDPIAFVTEKLAAAESAAVGMTPVAEPVTTPVPTAPAVPIAAEPATTPVAESAAVPVVETPAPVAAEPAAAATPATETLTAVAPEAKVAAPNSTEPKQVKKAKGPKPSKLYVRDDKPIGTNPLSRMPRALEALYLEPLRRQAEYGVPSCDLQLRSYSLRNLEFFCDFALRAAYYIGLPAFGPVPLPRITERWTVPKSTFVHKKSQENFERITLRRLIQIKDGHPETVQYWLAFLQKYAYYGIGMKANVWEFSRLDVANEMQDGLEKTHKLLKSKWEHMGAHDKMPFMENLEEFLANERRKIPGGR